MAIRDLKAVVYTDDDGNQWATAIDADVFAQNDGGSPSVRLVGGSDYTGSPLLEPIPHGLIPRSVSVSAGSNKRKVVCLDPTAALLAGSASAVSLSVLGGSSVSYTVYKKNRERDHRRFRDPNG